MFGLFRSVREIKETLQEDDLKVAEKMYVADGMYGTTMVTLQSGVFLVAFALANGASQVQIGLITTIGFCSQFMQLPGLLLVGKYPRRKLLTAVLASMSRLFWIPIMLLPLVETRAPTLLLVFLSMSSMIGAIPGPAWNSLLRDVIPSEKMGEVNGKRMILGTSIGLSLTLLGGFFIDYWKGQFPEYANWGYSIMFGGGLIFGLLGTSAIARIPEPRMPAASDWSLKKLLTLPIKDSNFRRLIASMSIWNFAVNMAAPFYTVYILKRLEYDLGVITGLVVLTQVTNLLFFKIWGQMSSRFSNKSVFAVSGPLFMLGIFLWCFTAMPNVHRFTLPLLVVIHILNGIAVAGVNIASAGIALKLSPKEHAHAYMTVIGLFGAATGALGPLFGGFLADFFGTSQLDIPVLFTRDTLRLQLPILSLQALDFVFLFSSLIGLLALNRLRKVSEYGSVEGKKVVDGLIESVILPIRGLSPVAGLRRIAFLPLSYMISSREDPKKNEL